MRNKGFASRITGGIAGLAAAAGVIFWCGSVRADSIFVDGQLASICSGGTYSTGSRDCSGAEGAAYFRIQDAVDRASAGDTIFIRDGVYTQTAVITSGGTEEAALVLRNHPGESPVLEGGNTLPQNAVGLIAVSGAAHIRIIGLQVRNSAYFGISVDEGTDILLEACDVGYSTHGGIVVQGGSAVSVEDCDVHHNNLLGLDAWHEAVSLSGVDGFAVTGSRVFDNLEEGIDAKYGSKNGLIHKNEVYGNGGPNIYIDSSSRIDVSGNLVYGSEGQGIGLAVEDLHNPERYSTDNIKVFNNIVYDNACGLWFWVQAGAESFARFYDVFIVNNVFHDNNRRNWGGIYLQDGGAANFDASVIVRNNIFLENTDSGGARSIRDDAGAAAGLTISHNLFKSGEPTDALGDFPVVTGDVGFIDAAGRDYRLRADSPAVDAGSTEQAPKEDFAGGQRPAEAVDIGAYEYGAEAALPDAPENLRLLSP